MRTMGTPAGPFFMGFVVKYIGITWIFWIYAIIKFAQFLAYLAIDAETLYFPENDPKGATESRNPITRALVPRRIDTRPLKLQGFIDSLYAGRYARVLIPSLSLAVAFCYGNIAIFVEMPIAFGRKFNFDAQDVGLQFTAVMIGCFLDAQLGGPGSDWVLTMDDPKKRLPLPSRPVMGVACRLCHRLRRPSDMGFPAAARNDPECDPMRWSCHCKFR
jgi:MFS family permease